MFTQEQIDELNVLILSKKKEFSDLIKGKGKSDELSNSIKESIQGFINQHIEVYEKEVFRKEVYLCYEKCLGVILLISIIYFLFSHLMWKQNPEYGIWYMVYGWNR